MSIRNFPIPDAPGRTNTKLPESSLDTARDPQETTTLVARCKKARIPVHVGKIRPFGTASDRIRSIRGDGFAE